jgi:hypothetical protein
MFKELIMEKFYPLSINLLSKLSIVRTQIFLIYIFLFLIIVFPNAFREIKAVDLLLIVTLSSFTITSISKIDLLGLGLLCVSWIGSIFLVITGSMRATPGSEIYILGSYVLAPAAWWFILLRLLKLVELNKVIHFILTCGAIAALEIILFFIFFDYLDPAIKDLLIADPNVTMSSSGIPTVRLHAISSLIFIVPAFFSLLIDKKETYPISGFSWIIASIFLTATILSGRSALIIVALASLAIFGVSGGVRRIGLIVSGGFFVIVILSFLDVNAISALSNVVNKVSEYGGEERLSQRDALLSGFSASPLIGQGYGVPANVIRNESDPWRYELFYHALLFHGGLFGFFTYMVPIFIALILLLRGTIRKDSIKRFALFGLTSFLVATYTNPYIEGIESQWMWILPFLIGLRSSYRCPIPIK